MFLSRKIAILLKTFLLFHSNHREIYLEQVKALGLTLRTLKSDLVVSGKKHSCEDYLNSLVDLAVSGLMTEAPRI